MITTPRTKPTTAEPVDEIEQFITTVAGWLNETRDEPRAQIALIVRTIGTAETMAILKEVLAIENAGGMQTINKTRRRTVGGVFFHLVKQRHAKELPPAFWTLCGGKNKRRKALGKAKAPGTQKAKAPAGETQKSH